MGDKGVAIVAEGTVPKPEIGRKQCKRRHAVELLIRYNRWFRNIALVKLVRARARSRNA